MPPMEVYSKTMNWKQLWRMYMDWRITPSRQQILMSTAEHQYEIFI